MSSPVSSQGYLARWQTHFVASNTCMVAVLAGAVCTAVATVWCQGDDSECGPIFREVFLWGFAVPVASACGLSELFALCCYKNEPINTCGCLECCAEVLNDD